jgi:hypothetical protein
MDMKYVWRLLIFVGVLAAGLWIEFGQDSHAQVGPPNQVICNNSAVFTGTGATASVTTPNANQRVYLCGWHITNTAASGSFTISYGTGSNCGTGTVAVTPALSVTSTAPSSDHIEYAIVSTPLNGELCVNATITTVTGVLWYYQG